MRILKPYILTFFGLLFLLIAWMSAANNNGRRAVFNAVIDGLDGDSTEVPKKKTKRSTYKHKDRYGDTYSNKESKSPLLLKDPSNIKKDVEIGDDTAGTYHVTEKVGDQDYRAPSEMTYEEFEKHRQEEAAQKYWKNKKDGDKKDTTLGNTRLVPKIVMSPTMDRIFGGNVIDIKPNGNVMLDFGGQFQRVDNPATPVRLQRMGQFVFNQTIQLNVQGKVGEKLKLGINWDTKATFDFENNLKIDYNGLDYEIIKKIDAGNISFPLTSQLIQGSQNLFGVRADMQFGKLWISAVAANQRGKADEIVIQNNAQNKELEIRADNYEDNRHYFLAQYFKDKFEKAVANTAAIVSDVTITNLEVYVTNRNNTTNFTKNIIALMDLGENRPYDSLNPFVNRSLTTVVPDNEANSLYQNIIINPNVRDVDMSAAALEGLGLQKVAGYETVKSARRLDPKTDYKYNAQLGYISLNSPLRNDDVLAVSYNYTVGSSPGPHTVGETQENYLQLPDANNAIILKLLRPTTIRTDLPMWDLQMKNIYNINQSNISKKNFQFRIIYKDDASGLDNPSIHEGKDIANKPLVQIFNLDNLNQNNDPQPDGNFDFVPNVTIDTVLGRIIFPVLEPFGDHLADKFDATTEVNLIEKYSFKEIYRKTKSDLLNLASKNKFFLRVASSSSSNNEIALPGLNISRGSVRITAGSTPLTEGTDYTVNYEQGRIKILNDGIMASAKEIRIKYEKADLFNFRQKTLTGARFDYKFNKDIVFGGTILHLNERPLITRVSIGDEPVSNTIIGLDINYQKESRTITKLVDKIPFISTKATSNVTLQAEYAGFIPGSSSLIGDNGTAYVDDFEGAENPFDLTRSPIRWKLGSTPYTLSNAGVNSLEFGYKRAKLAWYMIDNVFYTDGGDNKPTNISGDDIKNHYVRSVQPQEIYPNRSNQQVVLPEPVFNLNFYPNERGPYNYNVNLNADGLLPNPAQNFASITRAINTDTDFDNANIQYIEFWMMDPFMDKSFKNAGIPVKNKSGADSLIYNATGGKLLIHLGSISEDVLKDGQQSFENGLPIIDGQAAVKTNVWANVPSQNYINDAFTSGSGARQKQDIGLDGVSTANEASFYDAAFISKLPTQEAKDKVLGDPSADDFIHYLDPSNSNKDFKIIDRYKNYNGLENNSPENTGGQTFTPSSTNTPDNEDLNQNNTINDLEQYFEYEIDVKPSEMKVPNKYIIDKVTKTVNDDNVSWYLFRIPIRDPNAKNINNITDLKSIRYLRMVMTGWEQPVALRLAQFQLVAGQWRTFSPSADLDEKTAEVKPEPVNTAFTVSTVNIEENGEAKDGLTSPYRIPPGSIRDRDNTSNVERQLNEQSLRMCVDNLGDGRARAVFKNTNFNFMNYSNLKMFIHAESATISSTSPPDTSLRAFIRLGTDFTQNYYEIEVPLVYSRNPTTDENEIWRIENNVDVTFDDLSGIKASRNRIAAYDQRIAFSKFVNGRNISIVGNPDLSSVQIMMLGIKNPITRDQQDYSACIWMDEFRVTDFVNNAGHAAIGRANVKLADLGTVSLTGKYLGIGFGSIDQKISQRNLNEQIDYGIQSNVSLDKFLPTKAGMRIPLFVSYDKSISTPKFDPTNPDIKLEASLGAIEDATKREEMRQILIDQSTKRSINITNLSKVKTGKSPKSHIYDIENLSVSASYSDGLRTSYLIAENTTLQYKGGVRYNFTNSPKNYEPLKNFKLNSPYFKLIKDFNFSLLPSMLSFTADVNRSYNKIQNRNSFLGIEGVQPQYQKAFTFTRTYGLNWAFTKSLSLNYSANVLSIIDEEIGEINTAANNKKVEENLKKGGRMQRFDQSVAFNYKVPFDKLPFTDWISADTRYSATYLWQGASLSTADSLGNTIGNSGEKSINGKIDLTKLYNKVKFLKEINTPLPPKKPDPKDTIKPKPELKLVKGIFRKLMSFKSLNFTYSLKEGTSVPGFKPRPNYFGLSNKQEDDGAYAPGIPFILGSQNVGPFLEQAGRNNWISTNPNLNSKLAQTFTESIQIRTAFEPIKDFKVTLEAKRDRTGNYTENFRYDNVNNEFINFAPTRTGSYSVTFISIKTSFINDNSNNASKVFETFIQNRAIIKARLTALNENSNSASYIDNSQDVLIPAFIAAYTGESAQNVKLTAFPKIPLPNWKIDYSGLSNLAIVKKFLSSVTLNHSYSSVYSVGNYNNGDLYDNSFIGLDQSELDAPLASKFKTSLDPNVTSGVFTPIYVISSVNIKEAFSPLLGISIKTKKNVTAKIEYKKTRDLALSNAQVTELSNNEIVLGFGFTKTGTVIPIVKKTLKNDLTFRFDVRFSDTKTVLRKIEGLNTVTSGNLLVSIKPNISYVVNQRLNLQFYFDHTINAPKVSNSFYRTNTLFGVQVRFTLS